MQKNQNSTSLNTVNKIANRAVTHSQAYIP